MTASPTTGETVRGIDVFVSRFIITLVIDIHLFRGTGASTIYPLLACKLSDNWNLIGTGMRLYEVSTATAPEIIPDIDALSLQFANDNVKQNELEARIRIVHSFPDGPILESLFEDGTFRSDSLASTRHFLLLKYPSCDFMMCNPPFYSSADDVQKSAESKEFDPHAVRLVLHIGQFMISMDTITGMYWCGCRDDNRRG